MTRLTFKQLGDLIDQNHIFWWQVALHGKTTTREARIKALLAAGVQHEGLVLDEPESAKALVPGTIAYIQWQIGEALQLPKVTKGTVNDEIIDNRMSKADVSNFMVAVTLKGLNGKKYWEYAASVVSNILHIELPENLNQPEATPERQPVDPEVLEDIWAEPTDVEEEAERQQLIKDFYSVDGSSCTVCAITVAEVKELLTEGLVYVCNSGKPCNLTGLSAVPVNMEEYTAEDRVFDKLAVQADPDVPVCPDDQHEPVEDIRQMAFSSLDSISPTADIYQAMATMLDTTRDNAKKAAYASLWHTPRKAYKTVFSQSNTLKQYNLGDVQWCLKVLKSYHSRTTKVRRVPEWLMINRRRVFA